MTKYFIECHKNTIKKYDFTTWLGPFLNVYVKCMNMKSILLNMQWYFLLHCCSCIQCIQQKHQIRFEGRDSKVCCRLWSCWINDALLSADTALAFDTESHKSRFTRIRNWNTASNTSFENFIFYSIIISPWAEGASITSLYDHKYEYVFIF